jgi:hypothetical protein
LKSPSTEEKVYLDEIQGILREMLTSLKTLGLYPASHPAVAPAMQRVFSRMASFLQDRGCLDFGITEKEVAIQGEDNKEFHLPSVLAEKLHQKGVLTVRFEPGLTADELNLFMHRLATADDEGSSESLTAGDLKNAGAEHISLTMLDYLSLMQRNSDGAIDAGAQDLWQTLIGKVRNGNSDAVRKLADILQKPAGLLTLHEQVKENAVAFSMGNATDDHARIFADIHQQVFSNLSPEERKEYTRSLASMMVTDGELEPELVETLGQNFLEFPDGTLLDILAGAIVTSGKVDNRMATAFQRLLTDEERSKSCLDTLEKNTGEGNLRGFSAEIWEQVKSFILSGTEEHFMSREYHQVVDDLSKYHLEELKTTLGSETLSGIQSFLREDTLQKIRQQVFFDLAQLEDRPEVFHDLLIEVRSQLMEYVQQGNLGGTLETLKRIFSPHDEMPAEKKQNIEEVLFKDGADSWIPYLLQQIGSVGERDMEVIKIIFDSHQQGVAKALVHALGEERSLSGRKRISNLLIQIGPDAVPYLIDALNDEKWFLVRNVIMIMGKIGDKSCIEALLPLLQHPQFQVPREVLNTLSVLGGDEVVVSLRRILLNRNWQTEPGLQKAAARALKRIGTRKAQKVLKEGLLDRNRRVQTVCTEVLKGLL